MKREIKFRAYNKISGNIFLSPEEINHLGSWFDAHLPGALSDIDNCVIMQYTGLKDKNGVEIYEGDIIDINCYTGKVGVFKDIICKVVFKSAKFQAETECGFMRYDLHSLCTVIGNIYQNPELLHNLNTAAT